MRALTQIVVDPCVGEFIEKDKLDHDNMLYHSHSHLLAFSIRSTCLNVVPNKLFTQEL